MVSYVDHNCCKTQQRSALSASREHSHTGGSEHLFPVIVAVINYICLNQTDKVHNLPLENVIIMSIIDKIDMVNVMDWLAN